MNSELAQKTANDVVIIASPEKHHDSRIFVGLVLVLTNAASFAGGYRIAEAITLNNADAEYTAGFNAGYGLGRGDPDPDVFGHINPIGSAALNDD